MSRTMSRSDFERQRNLPRCLSTGKVCYRKEIEAQFVASQHHWWDGKARVYRCNHCPFYHITTQEWRT